jgi:hypothetical protein
MILVVFLILMIGYVIWSGICVSSVPDDLAQYGYKNVRCNRKYKINFVWKDKIDNR